MNILKSAAAALILTAAPLTGACGMNSSAAKSESPTLVGLAASSPQHETLVAAVQAAGLVETLSGADPYTIFAPTDSAFAQLPAGTVENLLKPENRGQLQSILTYHVVAGRVTAGELIGLIRSSGGEAQVKTVQGGTLRARLMGDSVVLTDANGGTASVVQADLTASNGVIHVTDKVSLPR